MYSTFAKIYSANTYGVSFSWRVSVCPSGTWLGHVHFLRYVFVLDIFCQQLWGVIQFGGCLCALRAPGWGMYIFWDIDLYWIYSANKCGDLIPDHTGETWRTRLECSDGRPDDRPGRPRLTARTARQTDRTARLTARTARLTARTAEPVTAGSGRVN